MDLKEQNQVNLVIPFQNFHKLKKIKILSPSKIKEMNQQMKRNGANRNSISNLEQVEANSIMIPKLHLNYIAKEKRKFLKKYSSAQKIEESESDEPDLQQKKQFLKIDDLLGQSESHEIKTEKFDDTFKTKNATFKESPCKNIENKFTKYSLISQIPEYELAQSSIKASPKNEENRVLQDVYKINQIYKNFKPLFQPVPQENQEPENENSQRFKMEVDQILNSQRRILNKSSTMKSLIRYPDTPQHLQTPQTEKSKNENKEFNLAPDLIIETERMQENNDTNISQQQNISLQINQKAFLKNQEYSMMIVHGKPQFKNLNQKQKFIPNLKHLKTPIEKQLYKVQGENTDKSPKEKVELVQNINLQGPIESVSSGKQLLFKKEKREIYEKSKQSDGLLKISKKERCKRKTIRLSQTNEDLMIFINPSKCKSVQNIQSSGRTEIHRNLFNINHLTSRLKQKESIKKLTNPVIKKKYFYVNKMKRDNLLEPIKLMTQKVLNPILSESAESETIEDPQLQRQNISVVLHGDYDPQTEFKNALIKNNDHEKNQNLQKTQIFQNAAIRGSEITKPPLPKHMTIAADSRFMFDKQMQLKSDNFIAHAGKQINFVTLKDKNKSRQSKKTLIRATSQDLASLNDRLLDFEIETDLMFQKLPEYPDQEEKEYNQKLLKNFQTRNSSQIHYKLRANNLLRNSNTMDFQRLKNTTPTLSENPNPFQNRKQSLESIKNEIQIKKLRTEIKTIPTGKLKIFKNLNFKNDTNKNGIVRQRSPQPKKIKPMFLADINKHMQNSYKNLQIEIAHHLIDKQVLKNKNQTKMEPIVKPTGKNIQITYQLLKIIKNKDKLFIDTFKSINRNSQQEYYDSLKEFIGINQNMNMFYDDPLIKKKQYTKEQIQGAVFDIYLNQYNKHKGVRERKLLTI